MSNKRQAASRKSIARQPRGREISLHAALAESVHLSVSSSDDLLAVLQQASETTVSGEWALREVECARELNFELSRDLPTAMTQLEQAVQNIMGVHTCVLFAFDETSGVYTCLNDEKRPGTRPRELTRVCDASLRPFVGATPGEAIETLQAFMVNPGGMAGMVVIAGKEDGTGFTLHDQLTLDLLVPYLTSQVVRFQLVKQSLKVPYVQSQVLDMAARLVGAVDQDAIIGGLLENFTRKLGFDACQYVAMSPETGRGEVLYEIKGNGKLHSYSHAGLQSKRRLVQEFSNLVGLFSSAGDSRHDLHLTGPILGDKPISEIFGLKKIQSALLLPLVDPVDGQVRGTFNLFHTTTMPISDESREIVRETVQLASGALARAAVLEKALAMASSDELTGLINRRGFYQRFESEIERARRQQAPLCVALVDVDHFKHFNDVHGHLSGDRVLRALAEQMVRNVRKSDMVCRFGGEEFAILLPDTSLNAAAELMDRIRASVEKMTVEGADGETLHVTISAGLSAVDTRPAETPHQSIISDALAHADELLYVAKAAGRNNVQVADGAC